MNATQYAEEVGKLQHHLLKAYSSLSVAYYTASGPRADACMEAMHAAERALELMFCPHQDHAEALKTPAEPA